MRVPSRRAIAFPVAAMLSIACVVTVPTASPAVTATPGSPRESSSAEPATTARSFLRNGSLDGGIQGWRFFAQPPSAGHGEWAPHEGLEGSGALHVSATRAGEPRQLMLWNAGVDSLPVGRRLLVSAWVRGRGCDDSPGLTVRIQGADGMLAFGSSQGTYKPTGAFGWTRIEASVPVPEGSISAVLSAYMPGGGDVWFDDFAAIAGDSLAGPERHRQSLEKGAGLLRVHSETEYSLRADRPRASGLGGAPKAPVAGPRLLIALPLDYREQVPLTFELSSRPAKRIAAARVYEDHPGNWVAEVDLLPLWPGQKILLAWTAGVLIGPRSFRDFPERAPMPREWPAEARPWLAASVCAEADDPRIRRVAATIRDTSTDVVTIITQTLQWLAALKNDDRELCTVFDAVQALDHRGSCLSNANLATALLRANDIPARVLGGYPSWSWDPFDCHFIVEACVPGYGWFPIEPTLCHAPVRPSDQVEVSIVSPEAEDDRALQRPGGAPGLPYLAIGEFVGERRTYLTTPALDRERGGSVRVDQLERFPRDAPAAEWNRALARAREAWSGWLAGKPSLDPQGVLRTRLSADSLLGVRTPTALVDRLAAH